MWGALRHYQRKRNQARERNFFFWITETTALGVTTLGELLIQTSPSSFLPSTSHSSFTPLFRKGLLRPGFSSAMS